jgi:hypothetical protein
MPPPGQGFATQVSEIERHARELPSVADRLRGPIAVLTEHTATPRPLQIEAVSAVERAYGTFTDELANRQRIASDRIVATAEALHDIAAVYRRVDGQG